MTLRKKRLRRVAWTPIFVATLVVALVAVAGPPEFEISRSTVDGGGAMRSTGGDFELSGSIGQPDAGVMAGDDFVLAGGFWFPIPLGDCEDDGDVDLFDHGRFTGCLTGPGGVVAPECRCFDIDRNETVDLGDFAVIQVGFTG